MHNGKCIRVIISHCALFIIHYFCFSIRDVAQSGSVLAWGARGRGFESRLPDKQKRLTIIVNLFCYCFSS